MRLSPSLFVVLGIASVASGSELQLRSFSAEVARAKSAFHCTESVVSPALKADGLGAMYRCIGGKAQTVKLFINEHVSTGNVESIKLIWNDWTRDTGYGTHSDKKEAQSFVTAFAKLYTGNRDKELNTIFFNNNNKTIPSQKSEIRYTYQHGAQIDERMLVLVPK